MSELITAGSHFRLRNEEAFKNRIQKALLRAGLPLIKDWKPSGKVQARVYRGQWIGDCPTCPNAEFVDPAWPFYVDTERCGQLFSVEFPKNLPAIEEVLTKRPQPHNRNWTPGETIKDLQRENKEAGI